MKRIIDKIPILLLCCISVSDLGSRQLSVMSLLTAVTVSSLSQFAEKSRMSLWAELAYVLLCLKYPQFFCFFPIILYDILKERRYYLCLLSGLLFILISAKSFDIMHLTLLLGCAYVSALLQNRSSVIEEIGCKLIETRDSSAELNMFLSDRNKRLLEKQDREIYLATLKERNRIAREIHDNVGHLLSRSILQVGALRLISDDKLRTESLSSLSDTLNNAMTTIRNSVHDLHDDSVDLKQSLTDAIKPLEEKNIAVKTQFDCTENVSGNIKFCIIGIVKESVSNIIKHSSADRVSLLLREHPAFFQLVIEDNGVCSGIISSSGMGLSNMKERVKSVNGNIDISSSKKGFKIFVTLKK